MVEQIIAQLVGDAVDARDALRVKALHVLNDWTRRQRKAPLDDKLADQRDAAALEKQIEGRAQPVQEQHLEVSPVLEQTDEFAHGNAKVFRITYPTPEEGDI